MIGELKKQSPDPKFEFNITHVSYFTYFCQEGSPVLSSDVPTHLLAVTEVPTHLVAVAEVPSPAESTTMVSGDKFLMKYFLPRSSFTRAERHSRWGSISQIRL